MRVDVLGVELDMQSDPRLFSPNGVDKGTLAMLARANFAPGDKALDLGCGAGVVGLYAARLIGADRVFLSDQDALAVDVARANARRNGLEGVTCVVSDAFDAIAETGFTVILANPPYHTDFSVAKRFIEKGFNRLALGGRMIMVTKRLDWYKNKLTAIFGGVTVAEDGGYFVFTARKKSFTYFAKKP